MLTRSAVSSSALSSEHGRADAAAIERVPAAPRTQAAITPEILTFNEEANIDRVLRSVAWAREVVVVDSGSTDATLEIARGFSNVRLVSRPFDSHQAQWEFAVQSTGVATDYVLALDADYEVPPAFVEELETRFMAGGYAGGVAGFEYRIQGRRLLGSVYPARLVVFRRQEVRIAQPGHTQEMAVDEPTYRFDSRLIHDDRKPLARFVQSQLAYARLEAARLSASGPRRWQDRLRRTGLMPIVAGCVGYCAAGGPLAGRAALRYAYERTLFECLLALELFGTTNLVSATRKGS
jgi:hypothetical protein